MKKQETSAELHKPVMPAEVVRMLAPERGGVFVDATLGLGGHAEAILSASPKTEVIGIDQDTEAIKTASVRLKKFGKRIRIFHANFSELERVLAEAGLKKADGVLADLGVSSLQLDSPTRGFSFRHDAPLDMRMNTESGETAADLLERLSEEEIANIIYEYGEEKASRRIARRIVEKREQGTPIKTTGELAELVARALKAGRHEKIHPATRTFQALRIALNKEIEILEDFLRCAIENLNKDGRLAVITFHSLEDRIVKQVLQNLSGKCFCPPKLPLCACGAKKAVEILTRKPVTPSPQEIEDNPRARSAKLRACLKLS